MPFLKTSRVNLQMQAVCLNAILKKHFRYSQFVKSLIAIEVQLYFLGLVGL